MNYFTKEQLEDITNSILSNPVVETLKELYDKYADHKEEVAEVPNEAPVAESLENTINIPVFKGGNEDMNKEEAPVVNPLPTPTEPPVVEPLPNPVASPVVEPMPNPAPAPSAFVAPLPNPIESAPAPEPEAPVPVTFNIPSFGETEEPAMANVGPVLATEPVSVNQNPIPFGGNPWEVPTNGVNNLMETTDNFNAPAENSAPVVENPAPPVETPQEVNVPFFGGPQEVVNNPIPVMERPQSVGPTMFGQFEQSYRG